MRYHDLWIFIDKNLLPEILDHGVREKVSADQGIVFPESLCEKYSVELMIQALKRSIDSTWEE